MGAGSLDRVPCPNPAGLVAGYGDAKAEWQSLHKARERVRLAEYIRLRIHSNKLGDVATISRYLATLAEAYNHLYAFHLIVDTAQQRHEKNRRPWSQTRPIKTISRIARASDVVLPEDRLRLTSVVVRSPGFWEFVGVSGPLEVIRKYLCDRHERRKDLEYRDRQDRERRELENEKLRMEIIRERVEVLRGLGLPISRLDDVQDKGLAEDAQMP